MINDIDEKIAYEAARNRVKKLKGFYIPLLVYLVVNVMIVSAGLTFSKGNTSLFEWKNYTTAFFWGIGLLAHGLNVFAFDLYFGKDWEERKIREFMERDKEKNTYY